MKSQNTPHLDPKFIAKQFTLWRNENKISMKKLGEVLSPEDEKPEEKNYITYYKRAERFLNGNHAMRVTDLQKICDFTGLSLGYFTTSATPKARATAALMDLGLTDKQAKDLLKNV